MKTTILVISIALVAIGIIWAMINLFQAGCYDWNKPFSQLDKMRIVGWAYLPIILGSIGTFFIGSNSNRP